MAHTPHRRVILDMDSSESPVHGQQEGAAYNGHFELDPKRFVRRRLIDMARRRQRPGAGSPAIFLKRRTALVQFPDLTPVLTSLPWAVIGGVATGMYMPERATQSLDIVVRPENGEAARLELKAAGYRYEAELSSIGGSSWTTPDGVNLDVVEIEATS